MCSAASSGMPTAEPFRCGPPCRGKAAHVGRQFEGLNAFERALPAIVRLVEIKNEVELRETQQDIAPAAARRSILMLGGRVEAGTIFNVTPDFCSFTVDRRINPEENLEEENVGCATRW